MNGKFATQSIVMIIFLFLQPHQCYSYLLLPSSSCAAAHSAYNFKELAQCLKKAFCNIQVVEILEKLTNFRDAVKSMLNRATTTPGNKLLVVIIIASSYYHHHCE
jgi:hypothetical protein